MGFSFHWVCVVRFPPAILFSSFAKQCVAKLAKMGLAARRRHPSNKSRRAEDKTRKKDCEQAGHPPEYTRSITDHAGENKTCGIKSVSLIT